MDDAGGTSSVKNKMKGRLQEEEDSEEEVVDSEDDDETIARIQRAHFAQAAAMNARRRAAPRPRPMSHKRKMEAVKNFHDFTKKLKKDTGITIRSLVGNNILELSDFSSDDSKTESDGLSEEEFIVNPNAVQELNEENESYIDPETGDIVETKRESQRPVKPEEPPSCPEPEVKQEQQEEQEQPEQEEVEQPKTLSISDIIDDGDLDNKNVEIAEVEESELCPEKSTEDLLDIKQEDSSQDFDITEKLKEMGEISVKPIVKKEDESGESSKDGEKKPEDEDDKKPMNPNALNVRRNIREVMDEKNLDASTLAAQRQESERLARVQEQQRIIREVQRQIAINRQNKIHQKTISLLQGGSSILKKSLPGQKLNLPNTVLVKLPSGETKKTLKSGQVELTKLVKPTTSGAPKSGKPDQKGDKKEVVEIVDSSSGEESSSSSSDSDDCIMLSDSEVPPSPEAEEDPGNSGLHVNDAYNIPDEQGRVLINIGHPENEEDIFLAPQIARVIKPHQIGGVRFLFDNIIESVERFSTSTGFGCILAHSMGLGKTLQIVCFCDIFLRHTASKTVLCIMPINTLQNWVAEFNMWLPLDASTSPLAAHGEVRPRNFPIYVLNDSHKTLQMRAKVVKDWTTSGGVLMIGYELYRLLSMKKDKKPRKKKKDAKLEAEKEKEEKKSDPPTEDTQASEDSKLDKDDGDSQLKTEDTKDDIKKDEKKEDAANDEDKKLLDEMYEALVKPGPDLVICDEGHRIKNSHSNISYALKQMRTKRRVVLTGYPLQNNLLEYWCMVDFVRPNYLGSKTEFCNMFERPIQNGQCIDSTPQDIRLMRYRAHVLHSLLVGFVQRRSHAVLQSTLPQKEEYVLLVRMTPLQRKLYDRFMNEVVRSTSVPNPLKAFAICCKIWNHPDVLYNFLKKRSEVNAAIEEDLDLEEIGGVTKAGRARKNNAQPRRPGKPRGASKKPAATIPPNTTTGPIAPRPDANIYGNAPYPNAPYGSQQNAYRPDQPSGSYPPYHNYQNPGPGYYPHNQGYNQNYEGNYYQQQPPYGNNYPNQYPQNIPPEGGQGYNQNYWGNGNYYGNSGYYNNSQYPQNNQQPQDFRGNPPSEYNNSQHYPPNYNGPAADQQYPGNAMQSYSNNQDGYAGNPQRPPYPGYHNQPGYSEYNANAPPGSYPNNSGSQSYSNQSYPPPYAGNTSGYGSNSTPYNQYDNHPPNYPGFSNNNTSGQAEANVANQPAIKNEPSSFPSMNVKSEPNMPQTQNSNAVPFNNTGYGFPSNSPSFPDQQEQNNSNSNFPCSYQNFPPHLETKPPLSSAGSGSPVTSWPITEIKTEVDKLKAEEKTEMKSESDGEVKIEDLDTKKIVKDESKKPIKTQPLLLKDPNSEATKKKDKESKVEGAKSDASESEDEIPKGKGKQKGKGKDSKKTKGKSKPRAKGRNDRKTSKEKNNDDSESEESEKEEKPNREEELAMVKKAEEMTYDWAAELLKDYIPGIIENSAKMELFFYILNESIKLGDRLLLFSQSLFTLNLIEDFLEKNYIPGTNCLWERNTNYYRLDGSTHALEREKLINEFNANPHIYLFLVSTRAGSLGINLVGANRVIVFDASWNPCHDTQAVCRVYRYGQRKPCFVYRFVMDCCLEKKIYDRQINKQGMADRVVDECNPDAVLSMKEITNLCFDNDEKESEIKDLSEHKDKYIDVLMQGVISQHGRMLSKEPFQHESLLVDRKEKKLSSAEKRLAQRGYELEKKAALAPKPLPAYRTVRTADGSLVQRPVASVRPMQHGARWIPADVWRRQGMTAQEMTLPLDVVIPTNSAEKTNIVLKAGQRVMVLKSPKGIYMQLESGKIIAIKTSFKGLGQKGGDSKDSSPIGKKVLGSRPVSNIPGSLKNNSAITITSKTGPRPGFHRIIRPSIITHNKMRPMLPGQKMSDIRSRLGELRSYSAMRQKSALQGRLMRPSLPGSVSITKIPREPKKLEADGNESSSTSKMEVNSDEDTQVLDSDEDDDNQQHNSKPSSDVDQDKSKPDTPETSKPSETEKPSSRLDKELKPETTEPIVLTTDEKLPSEDILENKLTEENFVDKTKLLDMSKVETMDANRSADAVERKINPLKNYRHQRPGGRPSLESSLSQLERTASVLNKEGMPDFRKNLDDITQSYSPTGEERPCTKTKKRRSPAKPDAPELAQGSSTMGAALPAPPALPVPHAAMTHSVSSLLGPAAAPRPRKPEPAHNTAPITPCETTAPHPRLLGRPTELHPHTHMKSSGMPLSMSHPAMMSGGTAVPADLSKQSSGPVPAAPLPPGSLPPGSLPPGSLPPGSLPPGTLPPGSLPPGSLPPGGPVPPGQGYPAANPPPDGPFGQYPGYGMGYGAYPPAAYYGGYGGGAYYAGYGAAGAPAVPPFAGAPPAPTYAPDPYLPPNPQW